MAFDLQDNLRLYMQIMDTDDSISPDMPADPYARADDAFIRCVDLYDNRFFPDAPSWETDEDKASSAASLKQLNEAVRQRDPEKTLFALTCFFEETACHRGPAMALRSVIRSASEQCALGFNITPLPLDELWDASDSRESFIDACRKCLSEGISTYTSGTDLTSCICQYIDAHCGGPLSQGDVASVFYLSPNYLSSLFKHNTGGTVSAYIRKRHMQAAKHLLLTTDLRVYEIAEKLGYKDDEYFSSLFKEHYGATPREMKKTDRLKAMNG